MIRDGYSNNYLSLICIKSVFIPFSITNINSIKKIVIKLHSCECDTNNESVYCQKSCQELNRVKSTKYLGVIFDDQLKWKIYTGSVITRIIKCSYIFKELRSILDINNIKIIYCAIVQSILAYGIII